MAIIRHYPSVDADRRHAIQQTLAVKSGGVDHAGGEPSSALRLDTVTGESGDAPTTEDPPAGVWEKDEVVSAYSSSTNAISIKTAAFGITLHLQAISRARHMLESHQFHGLPFHHLSSQGG